MEEAGATDIVTKEDLIRLAGPFADLINHMQREEGAKVQDVVSAALYTIGCAIAQIGSHIDVREPAQDVLPAFAAGYNDAIKDVKKKMI